MFVTFRCYANQRTKLIQNSNNLKKFFEGAQQTHEKTKNDLLIFWNGWPCRLSIDGSSNK
ncbi:hypothetical protein LCU01_11500 [Latilactobacillus curvatus]|nr:hypothetical protein LCU01_11500 [Latilactobacillus curvatus]